MTELLRALFGISLLTAIANAQETTRVSVDSSGAEGGHVSRGGVLSVDGQLVAFVSGASNLVIGDTNGCDDVFVHDCVSGTTERISVDSTGAEANDASGGPSISSDGRFVAFYSRASNLVAGDVNSVSDVFVRDRWTGTTERVSVDSNGAEADFDSLSPGISADGWVVAFESDADDLVTGDTNRVRDIFVHDRSTGLTERVSVDSFGAQSSGLSGGYPASVSSDGRYVAFQSISWDLVSGDTNLKWDAFVHDRSTGITERVSVDSSLAQANGSSNAPSISSNGQIVSFSSDARNLVTGDANKVVDVFVHDRLTGITERISVDSSGAESDGVSGVSWVSADGQLVAFTSAATNLVPGDTNGFVDVFVHDRVTGIIERVSVGSSGTEANDDNVAPSLAPDGSIVAFSGAASNLVAGDTNGCGDVFVHERCATFAMWSNYGSGFPGTNGVPSFSSRQNPGFGATITLDLANSYGAQTAGLLFVGFQRTSLHSNWGGDLLVVPALVIPIGLAIGGDSFSGTIPLDVSLCGTTVYAQAIEADPGAAKGVSFTAGLELVIGY